MVRAWTAISNWVSGKTWKRHERKFDKRKTSSIIFQFSKVNLYLIKIDYNKFKKNEENQRKLVAQKSTDKVSQTFQLICILNKIKLNLLKKKNKTQNLFFFLNKF